MADITDVAARAGVSAATVSRHLGGQTVRKAADIEAAIVELDYTPSLTARSLKSGVKYAVAVVVPDVTNAFFAAVVKGAESVSRQGPYSVFLYNTDEDPDREQQVVAALLKQVDGVILAPVNEHDATPDRVRRAGVPLVFIDRTLDDGGSFDSVLVDNAEGGAAAARHFIELGHERLAIITGPLDTTPGRERCEGFVAQAEALGVEVRAEHRRISDFREAGGYEEMLTLLGSADPPTAVFSCNNLMTVGALKALNHMGVAVPTEMSIIGFDDLDLAPLLSPPLTVIRRSASEQGALAMRLLLKRIAGASSHPRSITLSTELVIRGSCAPPPAPSPPASQPPTSRPRRKASR